MAETTVAIAGGSGFIGRAIIRRLGGIAGYNVIGLSRSPEKAAARIKTGNSRFVRAEATMPSSLESALAGANAIVNAVQFEGYPVEDPKRGLTFERVDLGGTRALLDAAKKVGATRFIYISGAAADETSSHPGFRAKGLAERAVRESGLQYTIFRPSLVYGAEDKVVNMLAKALRFAPVFAVPGTGRQKVQPVLVDDLAACVVLALGGKGINGTYEVGGPDLMTFDEMVRTIMEVTGRRRPIVHIPESLMRTIGGLAEKLPKPPLSRDAVTFVTADNACDTEPLVAEFGITLTPMRDGIRYLGV
ncbi:MAG TPA: complex I NDUFA9 subunit family protein [Candidatus Binataceae bacterium]|nr:complex I NDUFA9 subunit family protein [Candidatus Binataceae bacterium]